MRRCLIISLGLLALVGCGFSSVPAQRPADFSLDYNWHAGALPPPYHYEYSITINPDGQGEIVMVPDYPADDVPQWREPFQVQAADFDRLYQQFRDRGLFSQSWREEQKMHAGGSSEWMTVIASETEVEIPSQLVASQQATATELYTAVKDLVPAEIWTKLEAQREEYQAAHEQ